MRPKPNIILGISPGTRAMGWAVLSDGELVDWGVKNFKGKWSKKKEDKILHTVEMLITDYHISGVTIKRSHCTKSSRNSDKLTTSIKSSMRKMRVNFLEVIIDKLKQICGQAHNKKELADYLRNHFPELQRRHSKNTIKENLSNYEAIAAGLIKLSLVNKR